MSDGFKKETQFKTYWHHRKPAYWLRKDRGRAPGFRQAPEVVRLDVEPGTAPSGKPPVRIFLGTEPAQYRAERVFIWSVAQHRDPGRVYEIYLMKDLAGFDRRGWKTGFTDYRYAIPALAGGHGRAIYNDTDQIYLADPAELFDLEMGEAGILGVTERDTSVMLIDCDKMAPVWSADDARAGAKHRHFRELTHGHNRWGRLPGEWNARDEEFRPESSKCFHFTTLQMQPWQPFPEQLRYRPHPDGEVWFRLERAADEAGFTAFSRARPSSRFAEAAGHNLAPEADAADEAEIARMIREAGAESRLDCTGLGGPDGTADAVVSRDVLQAAPEDDVAWLLDELFAAAGRLVYVAVACEAGGLLPAAWWKGQMTLAARRRPGIRWALAAVEDSGRGRRRRLFTGGPDLAEAA